MSAQEFPRAVVRQRRGAVCTITSGDMPAFPAWFGEAIIEIQIRLYKEWIAAKVALGWTDPNMSPERCIERYEADLRKYGPDVQVGSDPYATGA